MYNGFIMQNNTNQPTNRTIDSRIHTAAPNIRHREAPNVYLRRRVGAAVLGVAVAAGAAHAAVEGVKAIAPHIGASSNPNAIPDGEMSQAELDDMVRAAQQTAADNIESQTQTALETRQIQP